MRWLLLSALFASLSACSRKDGTSDSGVAAVAPPRKDPQCINDTNKRLNGAKLSACRLSAEWAFGKLVCRKEFMLELYPDGTLKRCSLASPTDVSGFVCQESTEFYEDGKFKGCKLAASKNVNGVDVRAQDWITIYKSGTLKRVQLTSSGKLKGLPCKGFFNYFHENGQLKQCEIADATKIDGQDVATGTLVCFDDKGKRAGDCKMLTLDMLD